MNKTNNLSSLIWSSADDVLRGLFKPSEYGRVILPFVVMRRLDCVLEPKKDEIFNLYEKYKDKLEDPSPVIQKQVGFPFYNHSRFDLTRIKSDPNNVMMNFNNYIQGYSDNVRDIIDIGSGTRCKHCGMLHFLYLERCGACAKPMEYNLGKTEVNV